MCESVKFEEPNKFEDHKPISNSDMLKKLKKFLEFQIHNLKVLLKCEDTPTEKYILIGKLKVYETINKFIEGEYF